jgi:hypothetical protein
MIRLRSAWPMKRLSKRGCACRRNADERQVRLDVAGEVTRVDVRRGELADLRHPRREAVAHVV